MGTIARVDYAKGRVVEARTLIERYFDNNQPTSEVLWLGIRLARQQHNNDAEASYGLQLRRMFPEAPETQLLLQGKYD